MKHDGVAAGGMVPSLATVFLDGLPKAPSFGAGIAPTREEAIKEPTQ